MVTGNGNGNAEPHFNNARLEECIGRFQREGDAASLSEIVELSQPRAETLIRFHNTHHYRSEDELLSDINFKLLRSIAKFDPAKGSGFTYVSKIIDSSLRTSVTITRRNWLRNCELSDELANTLHAKTNDQSNIDDIAHRIRSGIRTTLDNESELQAARWLVNSFLDGAFELPRWECANATEAVYGIGHHRSRELHDLIWLAIRRVLYDDLPPRQPIAPQRLCGTRSHWIVRFQPLLTGAEFTKLTILTRNLSPFVIMMSSPQSKSRRLDRNPPISREMLLWTIHGHPSAKPLFEYF
jgi:hypothetical protein